MNIDTQTLCQINAINSQLKMRREKEEMKIKKNEKEDKSREYSKVHSYP